MNKKHKAVTVMAVLLSVGATGLIGAGPAAAMTPTPPGAESLTRWPYPQRPPLTICDIEPNAPGCR